MYVTRPQMPDFDEFTAMLSQIWKSRQLTNGGEFHTLLEQKLSEYLGVPYISLFANGTLPLMVALKALGLEHGEVVTSPYSFVATAHALHWSGMTPVFADIEPKHCTLSVEQAERAITPQTKAIMPVHVYGRVCDVKGFEALGQKYGIPIIYDAAHAFGVKIGEESVLAYGDLASLSFHATKVFNTIEGGALVCRDVKMKDLIDKLKNFGFASETRIVGIGINGKLDEIRSAWGLLNLKKTDEDIKRRLQLSALYRSLLADVEGISSPTEQAGVRHNGFHFPIFVNKELYGMTRDELYTMLKTADIHGRRYFYPLITDFEPYASLLASQPGAEGNGHNLIPNAVRAASEVLCLPLYPELTEDEVTWIADMIRRRAICGTERHVSL